MRALTLGVIFTLLLSISFPLEPVSAFRGPRMRPGPVAHHHGWVGPGPFMGVVLGLTAAELLWGPYRYAPPVREVYYVSPAPMVAEKSSASTTLTDPYSPPPAQTCKGAWNWSAEKGFWICSP